MSSRAFAGAPFPYRDNSLNLFRLILAALVLFAHAFYIVGRGDSPGFNGENLGGWAVAGFFVVSGFLITRSRFRTGAGEYLLHRVARIFPAFLVCLVVTAFVFAPLALWISTGSLSGFLRTPVTPLQYVWGNITLYIEHYSIGETLSTVPYPDAWNGSLWTLYYEFLCYIAVWVLGGFALYRRSLLGAGLIWAVSVGVHALTAAGITGGLDGDFELFARLFPFFIGGSLIYLVIERWGLVPLVGWLSIPVAAMSMVFVPNFGGQLAAPALAYGILFLSTVVSQPAWIARNDVSYGFYIYAWPVQQLTVLVGGATWALPVYIAVTVVVTFSLAWLSWVAIERPAMLRVRNRRSGARQTLPGDIRRA
ncbi:peptidoglycan/LPS O-acetylase OafA/YrhL [Microbacterium sp. SLBN-154]|uniref:acyltransferase family protein n=1 Tax=Microbacterium sp. SLBN-154 TaxID=2768458 RepID=UPI001170D416|nr:acyltransferase [Microbacterium sp. SLBN-154]TQK18998.1 peptidoglycan/LPS O-acetylase OafA/YrhL [Microbacterium sp. SLBN-154]